MAQETFDQFKQRITNYPQESEPVFDYLFKAGTFGGLSEDDAKNRFNANLISYSPILNARLRTYMTSNDYEPPGSSKSSKKAKKGLEQSAFLPGHEKNFHKSQITLVSGIVGIVGSYFAGDDISPFLDLAEPALKVLAYGANPIGVGGCLYYRPRK